jgi:virulence-associated protein VagC
MPETGIAKLLRNGRSQAVRLPREFRFEGSEVRVRRLAERVLLEPLIADTDEWFAENRPGSGRPVLWQRAEPAGDAAPGAEALAYRRKVAGLRPGRRTTASARTWSGYAPRLVFSSASNCSMRSSFSSAARRSSTSSARSWALAPPIASSRATFLFIAI